jgi:hypothetical protein
MDVHMNTFPTYQVQHFPTGPGLQLHTPCAAQLSSTDLLHSSCSPPSPPPPASSISSSSILGAR